MKILILGHYEIASNYAISLLVDKLILNSSLDVRIALSGKGDKKLEKNRANQNEFVALANYERMLCDQLNLEIDSLQLNASGYDYLSKLIDKPIALLLDPNSKSGITKLKSWAPDLIVSIRYRKIFKEEAIRIPNYGIINLHSGLLPEYRGTMATFWAMLNREEYFGSTLHYISDRGIDSGAIIERNKHKLDYDKSYLLNVLSLYPKSIDDIVKSISFIEKNGLIKAQVAKNKGNYYSFPDLSDLMLFKQFALKLY